MDSKITWKLILIVFVLLVCGYSMYPPKERLNLGIDLRGGTSLLYEVDTQDANNPEELIKQTIAILQKRVDPAGVRNLVWRVESGNRVEIQMPLASQSVVELRKQWREQFDQLSQRNIQRAAVISALRLDGAARTEAIKQLAHEVPGRAEALETAAATFDALQDARAGYEKVKDDEEKRIDEAGKVAAAELAFDAAIKAVLETNISPVELGNVLELSTVQKIDPDTKQPIEGSSPREAALEKLFAQHPSRADQIRDIVGAFDAYQKVKGPLDDPEDLKRLLQGAGVLEFRIAVSPEEAADADAMRRQLQERGPRAGADATMKWFLVDDPTEWTDKPADLKALQADPAAYFLNSRGLIGAGYGGDYYLLLWDTPAKSITQKQPGWELSQASPGMDQRGFPAVDFALNEIGGSLMDTLTSQNMGRQMAIVLDGRVFSAPSIRGNIRSRGQISGGRGGFSPVELEYLIQTLNAGSLKARLSEEPISERNIGPAIGADNLHKGLDSAIDAMIIVAIFMMLYYFFAGAVADFALFANLVIILGIMASLQATFTLPGIAGIVLTIGMAVDANVLIFERIREELRAGRNITAAMRLGYQKALSSIIDGNLTNLIVCFVLGYTATADVKGFAVTLGIGICATLFTALFMTRVFFDLYHHLIGIKRFPMLPLVVPAIERTLHPRLNWIGRRYVFFGISGTLMVLSLFMVIQRGSDIFDIEFRAGTEVEFALKEGNTLHLQDVRDKLVGTPLEEATVVPVGETDQQVNASRFSIITTDTDSNQVAQVVRETFADVIDIQPVIHFAGQGAEEVAGAPVYPITRGNLGEVVNEPGVENDVQDAVGGVAVLLKDVKPSSTVSDLEARIKAMRLQPDFEHMQFRPFRVIGIKPDPSSPSRFVEAAVIVPPTGGNSYFEDEANWQSFAGDEWHVVSQGLGREKSLSRVSNFSPTVATTMANNAIVAVLLSIIAIVIYIWFRFGSFRHGIAAVVALIHDVTITLGLVALSGFIYDNAFGHALLLDPFRINMGMVAALLTIIGYSLNDTIIVFDRIRENRGKLAIATPRIMNDSINQTVSRTIITSGTTFLAIVMMYIFGGEGIHNFAFAMTVGVMVGTYSSIAVASPLLLVGTKYAFASAEASAPTDPTAPADSSAYDKGIER
ncbi:protein translocase subunit SecD [Planctomycetales bacterium ZRK34]|nr:protein translocase subunit SecD [Planctomycetales bacterium ZRK34]